MIVTETQIHRIENHYCKPCEISARGDITYKGGNCRVGYVVTKGEWEGWVVDVTGDKDELMFAL